jgi:hypothetical protein
MILFNRLSDGTWSRFSEWPKDVKMGQLGIDASWTFGYFRVEEAIQMIEEGIKDGSLTYNQYVITPVVTPTFVAEDDESKSKRNKRGAYNRKVYSPKEHLDDEWL